MSSTFPTKLADDYVPPAYLRPPSEQPRGVGTDAPTGDTLRFIAFRSGGRVLAVTAVDPAE